MRLWNEYTEISKMPKKSMLKKLLLLSTFLFPANLLADECFCLIDGDDGLWFDCRVEESAQAEKTAYACADPGGEGKRKRLDVETGKRISAGTPPCTPCRLREMTELASPPRAAR
uniref:CVNH domain-containing protein n=1 Tax=Candidatus Kentrum sp. TC TaxID=2126339 RepID=A0A450YE50_9GAMM|nr:MAG: hypothetical protein BECKTC1821E_GA0114239_100535 [Candidatus Kentron sp. TC]